jgi:hypothetical protein
MRFLPFVALAAPVTIVLGPAAGADDKKDLKQPNLELAAALEKQDEKATRKWVDRLKRRI